MCHCSRHGKTFGEALVAAIGLGGFFYLASKGPPLTGAGYFIVLAITTAFYAGLLLVRAIFTFMVGNDQSNFWWEKYAEDEHKHHHKHHHDHEHGHHPDQPQGH